MYLVANKNQVLGALSSLEHGCKQERMHIMGTISPVPSPLGLDVLTFLVEVVQQLVICLVV